MKPTREQIEIIVLDMMKQEFVIDEFEKVVKMMAPEGYKPIITIFNPLVSLKVLLPDIYECISYWWYDCYSFPEHIGEIENMDGVKLQILGRSLESLKKYLIFEDLITFTS